jgi:ribosomal protein S18 acetylase RimI-like enzyme
MSEILIRPARREDAWAIARLFLISSDGLAEYIWERVAEPEEGLLDAGARRYAREGVAFSYENCLVADRAGEVVAMAHAFPIEASDEPETDPVLRPYAELEDHGSLYLSGLAVLALDRGQGIGARLLQATEARAGALALPRLSLICLEGNRGAMRFYARHGYREIARRAIVPHPCLRYASGDAVLLVRDLAP